MTRILSSYQKRKNRAQDTWILYCRNKISMEEYHRLLELINSSDEENLVVATALIKEKFRKPKKV